MVKKTPHFSKTKFVFLVYKQFNAKLKNSKIQWKQQNAILKICLANFFSVLTIEHIVAAALGPL